MKAEKGIFSTTSGARERQYCRYCSISIEIVIANGDADREVEAALTGRKRGEGGRRGVREEEKRRGELRFRPAHLDMRDALEDEGVGGLTEADALVEALGVFLSLDLDRRDVETADSLVDSVEHDLLAEALAANSRENPADRSLLEVSAGGA